MIIITFVVMDVAMAFLKEKFHRLDKIMDGTPIILINDGHLVHKMMNLTKVDNADILEAARKAHGIASFDKIKYAVLEKGGEITIIPR